MNDEEEFNSRKLADLCEHIITNLGCYGNYNSVSIHHLLLKIVSLLM